MKTNVYNVVILDKSGSMSLIKQEAINGYNETLQTIIAAQIKHAETQEHFVTLVTFDSNATDMVYDRMACKEAAELTNDTYRPGSLTPLYDAMGTTLSNFRRTLDATANNKVLVTIITDGQENASKEYTGGHIRLMVDELKALGWVFTYIGANHDVKAFARKISVENVLEFEATSRGMHAMFEKEKCCRMRFFDKVAENKSGMTNFFDEADGEI